MCGLQWASAKPGAVTGTGLESPLNLLTPRLMSNQGYERQSQVEHLLRDLRHFQEAEEKRRQEMEKLRTAAKAKAHLQKEPLVGAGAKKISKGRGTRARPPAKRSPTAHKS